VVASSRRPEQVDEAAKAIEAMGRRALRLTSDVAERATLQALLDGTVKEFGKVDILINSACSVARSATSEVSRSALRPMASIAFAASSTCSGRRELATTSAPASASPIAIANPIPEVPPTTTADYRSNQTTDAP